MVFLNFWLLRGGITGRIDGIGQLLVPLTELRVVLGNAVLFVLLEFLVVQHLTVLLVFELNVLVVQRLRARDDRLADGNGSHLIALPYAEQSQQHGDPCQC